MNGIISLGKNLFFRMMWGNDSKINGRDMLKKYKTIIALDSKIIMFFPKSFRMFVLLKLKRMR